MNIHKNPIYKSLKLLVKQSKKIQKVTKKYRNSRTCFLKEFCTVKVATASGSGHSTVLSVFAANNLSKDKKVLVLSYNLNLSDRMQKIIVDECKDKGIEIGYLTKSEIKVGNGRVILGSKGQLTTGSLRGYEFDYILVDIACMWNNKEVNSIYKELGPSLDRAKYPIIVFVE